MHVIRAVRTFRLDGHNREIPRPGPKCGSNAAAREIVERDELKKCWRASGSCCLCRDHGPPSSLTTLRIANASPSPGTTAGTAILSQNRAKPGGMTRVETLMSPFYGYDRYDRYDGHDGRWTDTVLLHLGRWTDTVLIHLGRTVFLSPFLSPVTDTQCAHRFGDPVRWREVPRRKWRPVPRVRIGGLRS
jgi:hypothetical protein